jgi:hypothetical protein
VVFRGTTLDDKAHIEFARRFGELDDIKPYLAEGRKNRLQYDELFDVSNVEDDGSLVDPNGPRGQANKVRGSFYLLYLLSCTIATFTYRKILGQLPFPCRLELQPLPSWLFSPACTRAAATW